jgi:hypothetical protein
MDDEESEEGASGEPRGSKGESAGINPESGTVGGKTSKKTEALKADQENEQILLDANINKLKDDIARLLGYTPNYESDGNFYDLMPKGCISAANFCLQMEKRKKMAADFQVEWLKVVDDKETFASFIAEKTVGVVLTKDQESRVHNQYNISKRQKFTKTASGIISYIHKNKPIDEVEFRVKLHKLLDKLTSAMIERYLPEAEQIATKNFQLRFVQKAK